MTLDGLRAQYSIPNLSLSAITYPSIRPFRSGHVTTQSRKISANSSLAERKQTADRKPLCRIFLKKPSFFRTDFFTKLGSQIRLLPVPNFGVNSGHGEVRCGSRGAPPRPHRSRRALTSTAPGSVGCGLAAGSQGRAGATSARSDVGAGAGRTSDDVFFYFRKQTGTRNT
jgi:hypothetical protein